MDGLVAGQEGWTLDGTCGKLNITVLMGGPSSERGISLISGEAVAAALSRVGHNVRRADINPARTAALEAGDIDVVFIAMHGRFGESGQVQELCGARSLAYTGSDPHASELAMDKAAAKQAFRQAALHTPDWLVVEEYDQPEEVGKALSSMSLPVVVKPIDGGSSLDITIASSTAQRAAALEDVLDRYSRAMVEQFVHGREMTVGIVADKALPVLEIIPAGKFYDYRSKYADCGTKYVFDHGLDEKTQREMQTAALKAFRALGCRDFGRVDFILDEHQNAQLLEVNTIPGFTSHSLLPMAAAKAGISFDRLVDGIVAMAMRSSEA